MTDSAVVPAKAPPVMLFRRLSLVAAAPVAVLSVFRAVPAEWPVLVVQLLSFTPWLALPAALGLLLALLGKSRLQQVLAATLLACHVFWLFPLDAGRTEPAEAAGTVELKAMTVNSLFGQADAAAIVRLVRENGVGLLTVQEHSRSLEERLTAEGLDVLLPNRVSHPTDDGAGSAVYSRYPLEHVGLIPDSPFRMPTVRLTAQASSGAVAVLEVTNVHTLPPVDHRVEQWRSDLAAVGKVAARPGNRLLIGDFNATFDHPEFRELLAGGHLGHDGNGLVDVGTAAGRRLMPTWPMAGHLLPGITIDHLVTSPHIPSSGYNIHQVEGTDHAAVLAVLVIPAA
jgi:endonuclease/exonuclease/phosphatase family metal-dependent hydrolase